MNTTSTTSPSSSSGIPPPAALPARSTWRKKLLIICAIVLGVAGLSVAASAWWVKRNIYASSLNPVSLSANEQAALDKKLSVLNAEAPATAQPTEQQQAEAKRTLTLTEKEINAHFAKQGLGDRVKVELNDGHASATALIPLDKDFPIMGGSTLRLKLTFAAHIDADKPATLQLSDVSVGGVPLPSAWLGDIKGANLLAADVQSDPVAKRFRAGIKTLEIKNGALRVVLNE